MLIKQGTIQMKGGHSDLELRKYIWAEDRNLEVNSWKLKPWNR